MDYINVNELKEFEQCNKKYLKSFSDIDSKVKKIIFKKNIKTTIIKYYYNLKSKKINLMI